MPERPDHRELRRYIARREGLTGYTPFSSAEATLANTLASLLDNYNNNGPCPALLPMLPPIAAVITSASKVTFTIGTKATFTVMANVGFPPPTLSESGNLPGGVTLNAGVLSDDGTSQAPGTYSITFTATNSTGGTVTQSFTLTMKFEITRGPDRQVWTSNFSSPS